jgi:hypothetical protein
MGQLSEEAQETRNKDLKLYRRSHTRKVSRETTTQSIACFIGSLCNFTQKVASKIKEKSFCGSSTAFISPK